MPAEQLVVITDVEDEQSGHVPLVQAHIAEALTVIDPAPAVVVGQGLSYVMGRHGLECLYNDTSLDRVAAVWDRRPTPVDRKLLEDVHPDYRGYAQSSIWHLTHQLYSLFPDAVWVSDYFAAQRAEHKSLQLITAQQLGFAVPETIITSDPKRAQQFISRHPATIIKSLSAVGPIVNGDMLLFYSMRVTPDIDLDFENLNIGPAIFQQAVEVDHDLRITVVGDKIFPAAIVADAEKDLSIGVRDWRIGNYLGELSIEACALPEDAQQQCFALVKTLGLRFGAIDMVMDKKGQLWFLEINPNGQWGFVEHATQQPIGKAMARLLLSGRA